MRHTVRNYTMIGATGQGSCLQEAQEHAVLASLGPREVDKIG